jgi:hypothetical protein
MTLVFLERTRRKPERLRALFVPVRRLAFRPDRFDAFVGLYIKR